MGTAVSKKKNLRNDAISSVAAKVRAARAFGEYLSHTHPENRNGSDHLLSDTFIGQDTDSPDISRLNNNNSLQPYSQHTLIVKPSQEEVQPGSRSAPLPTSSKRHLSIERSVSSEDQHHQRCVESSLKPARVYTITRERDMLGGQGSKECLELEVLKRTTDPPRTNAPCSLRGSHHRGSNHRGNNGSTHQHHYSHAPLTQPLQSSGSAHNIRDWGSRRSRSREDCTPDCVACIRPHCQSQRSLDLETSPHSGGKQHKKLERMYSEDRVSSEDREDHTNSWFPKENMFSFQTATTTMQAISAFRGIAERKRRKREQEATALMERNFRKHLRMVGSRRVKAQTFADRNAKSFSRSWSDPTPVKPDSLHDSRDSGDLQASSGNLDEEDCDDVDWEEERESERAACEGDDFIPPKIMLISSKVPKAEYVPNIIRRDDPSIIPILYDHEHATFDDILEEIEKKLTAYRKGCKIWNMLIFCQGGPGHLYLLKNKVATFAKVEKEEDMIQFWKRLGRFMSLLNPKPNLIHIMGCYVLGNANGEKLFQNVKRLMKPHAVEFKSPLELSAQGKEMIEMYFDFRLYRLWKSRQHSKLLDYDDLL
ncbi:NMDA receptor synaptonuclear signaling and neuronal migration factor isoform X1 [Carassius auratus]|uniref:NMDA receptor synaptonuclear signaling and neuronal migration factor isoform X1 n=1 Tax=Carassius auratus TaxID=7957 RepID=A0A6P6K453_CARAU|nr:NMDA receptor synaptonuclear signaling and neuronal migration factor isoform X1 [Carassius auratus]XP_026066842.1 NMDA receptor synaptonuclear signaling and neuronal migration factor isoform X1 [Carassius auratus]